MKYQICNCLLLSAAVLLLPSSSSAQGTVSISEPVSISTEGNRALALMLDKIQDLYSTAVDFEEVPLENSADMEVTPLVMKSGAHLVSARGGKLTVQLDKNDQHAYQAVQTVLAAYTSSGLPGLYQAIDEGDHVDVFPVQIRSATGTMRSVTPIMDSVITLGYKPRQLPQLLFEISAAISKVSGYPVYLSTAGVNESPEPGDVIGFSGEKARDVLAKYTNLSYQVLYDPGEKAYYLNLRPATLPSTPVQSVTERNLSKHPKTSPWFTKP